MTSPLHLRTALAAGRAAGGLSRRLGRGAGAVVRGRVALALAPEALRDLAVGRRAVMVTGTNGKSTTTKLVAAALGDGVATNSDGANMAPGLLTALDDNRAENAVLEVDELHVPAVIAAVSPKVLITLNLTRDQLDRTHEVASIAQRWGKALAGTGTLVVANAGDPNVADAALGVSGISVVWVDPGLRWTEDASVCPRCGEVLRWFEDDGVLRWSSACGFAMPRPDYVLGAEGVRLPDGRNLAFTVHLPGHVNRGNAVFAIAAAVALGVPAETAAVRIESVYSVDGRYARLNLGGRGARVFLAKNPAGWAAALSMIDDGGPLAIGINARTADGTDTSWLYDVPFEHLAGRVIGAFGDRRADLAVRLHYAGAKVLVDADPVALAAALGPGELTLAANYTAFRELRRYLVTETPKVRADA